MAAKNMTRTSTFRLRKVDVHVMFAPNQKPRADHT